MAVRTCAHRTQSRTACAKDMRSPPCAAGAAGAVRAAETVNTSISHLIAVHFFYPLENVITSDSIMGYGGFFNMN